MNIIQKISRLVFLGLISSLFFACSSSGQRHPDDYYKDPYYYDSYYRGGVYNHHNRYYRRAPVRRGRY